MSVVFISYSSDDVQKAERLQRELEALGHTVWWDKDSIPGGSLWEQKITEGLDTAHAVAVLWSKNSAASKWVTRELIYADKRNLQLIPLLLDDTPLNLMLEASQAIDMRSSWKSGINQLNTALIGSRPFPAPPLPLSTATPPAKANAEPRIEIIVAVIGAAAIIMAALIGILPHLLDDEPPTMTPVATTIAPTEVEIVVAPLFTPTHTQTVSPTPQAVSTKMPASINAAQQAEFTLETLNQWRMLTNTDLLPCAALMIDDTLNNIAQTQLSDLQTYSFPQLTAEPILAYRTSAGLTIEALADLRGYRGQILPRIFITSTNTQITVSDILGEEDTLTCAYTSIGTAQREARGSDTRYLVVLLGMD